MDAFESIVAIYLDSLGYWVKQSVKVNITGEEKRELGTPSMPTPEIDLVAYKNNKLILVEVKSFLDSDGVRLGGLNGADKNNKARYKLLNDPKYQKIVTNKLLDSFIDKGFINKGTDVQYALAAGKIYNTDAIEIRKYLKTNKYLYFEPADIQNAIKKLKGTTYLNDSVTLTVKLLREHFKE